MSLTDDFVRVPILEYTQLQARIAEAELLLIEVAATRLLRRAMVDAELAARVAKFNAAGPVKLRGRTAGQEAPRPGTSQEPPQSRK